MSGGYFRKCRQVKRDGLARDRAAAEGLWEVSQQLAGFTYSLECTSPWRCGVASVYSSVERLPRAVFAPQLYRDSFTALLSPLSTAAQLARKSSRYVSVTLW